MHVPKWKGRGRHPSRLTLCNSDNRPSQVKQLARHIPKTDQVKDVIKEPMACEFAFLRVTESRRNLPAGEVWLIIRRNRDGPSVIKYDLSNAPAHTPLSEFVRISGMSWPIETIFEEAKGEVSLDHYEMRSWLGWHNMLLVSLAHHFLVRLRTRFQKQAPAPLSRSPSSSNNCLAKGAR